MGDSAKAKRKEAWEENAEKLKWLPEYEKSLGSYTEICNHTSRIVKARLRKNIFVVNSGKQTGVDTFRYYVPIQQAGSDRQ